MADADHTDELLLPALAEPHAHLDKAFLSEVIDNPTGDLMGAIAAMSAHRERITLHDTVERAERAARLLAANGCTAIRTHADVIADSSVRRSDALMPGNELVSVEALLTVRERLRDLVQIQVVALCGWPSVGPAGAEQRAVLREAIAMGVDVVGGCPHLEEDPHAANESFLEIAAEAGLPVDLHTDETLDPAKLSLDDLSRRVIDSGFPHRVTASHCVSLGIQPSHVQQRVAEQVAAAGIAVVVLPHTNLFLQGRGHRSATPRGLTAVHALLTAGVDVAAGGDNLQDPFNPIGRADPLETAGLMMIAGHLLADQALDTVSRAARVAMGLGPTADQVRVPAATVREAIAFGPPGRAVVRG